MRSCACTPRARVDGLHREKQGQPLSTKCKLLLTAAILFSLWPFRSSVCDRQRTRCSRGPRSNVSLGKTHGI